MGTVVVVGSVNADLLVLVDRLPDRGETAVGRDLVRSWGGKGGNQAVAARRYGADTAFVGAVGGDDFGVGAVEALEREGIDVRHVQRRDALATGVAMIAVDPEGENQIVVALGANREVDASGLGAVLGSREPGVLLTSFEISDQPVIDAVDAAHAAGWQILVNPAPARPIPWPLQNRGALLTPNEQELQTLAGRRGTPEELAVEVAERLGFTLVVTLGARGALIAAGDGNVIEAHAPTVAAVDSTGAGDVFNGVLAASLADGRELADAVRTAVAAASFSVEAAGAREGMMNRQLIEARLEAWPVDAG